MDQQKLYNYLSYLGKKLKKPTNLVLIGSCVNILKKQPNRITEDIDIWIEQSDVDINDLIDISNNTTNPFGIKLDLPNQEINVGEDYIQLINSEIAKMGKFTPIKYMTLGNLNIFVPPTEFLIASKLRLVNEEEKYEQDILYLINRENISKEKILNALETFESPDKEMAAENLVLFFYDDFNIDKNNKPKI